MGITSRAAAAACAAGTLLGLIAPLVSAGADTVEATVVQSILTSKYNPPSPDPSGITYIPSSGRLLIVDSEVEEMGIYRGVDLWETNLSGSVTRTGDVTRISREPTGVAFDPSSSTLYVSDDNSFRITAVKAGSDGKFGTSTTTWAESGPGGVTWNTQPAFDAGASPLASLGSVAKGTTYDVTLPASYITSDGTYSLVVSSTWSDGADFWSREKGGSLVPQLIVTVS